MIEMHLFTNPLHIDYFKLDPIIQKLQIEYGNYFKLNQILFMEEEFTPLSQINFVVAQNVSRQKIFKPNTAYVALKSASFQGKQHYANFVTQLQIAYFIEQLNISEHRTLHDCAIKAGLDILEFCHDIGADTSIHALQKDFKVINEMCVEQMPTITFFSSNPDEEGIQLEDIYDYHVYENIILNSSSFEEIVKEPIPSLLEIVELLGFFPTETVAVILEESIQSVENELKKLILQRKVDRIEIQSRTFWRAI